MDIGKINKEYIGEVIKYYVLMARWLYELGDYTRTKYLQMNLEGKARTRPYDDYKRLFIKYYDGNSNNLKNAVFNKSENSQKLLKQLLILSRDIGVEQYFDRINPRTGRREIILGQDDGMVIQNFCTIYSKTTMGSKLRRKNTKDIIKNILIDFIKVKESHIDSVNQEFVEKYFSDEKINELSSEIYKGLKGGENVSVRNIIAADRVLPFLLKVKTIYSLENNFQSLIRSLRVS